MNYDYVNGKTIFGSFMHALKSCWTYFLLIITHKKKGYEEAEKLPKMSSKINFIDFRYLASEQQSQFMLLKDFYGPT
jgi:hypothetical protein